MPSEYVLLEMAKAHQKELRQVAEANRLVKSHFSYRNNPGFMAQDQIASFLRQAVSRGLLRTTQGPQHRSRLSLFVRRLYQLVVLTSLFAALTGGQAALAQSDEALVSEIAITEAVDSSSAETEASSSKVMSKLVLQVLEQQAELKTQVIQKMTS